ncbi:MAG: XdhC family protein, partial [Sphingomonadales bacterium]|nr:XdhC family protein [Sphingomonadales bacterium]
LARDDILYCGLIGSATKRARFEKRYREDGLAEDAIARLTCPIGAGGPRGKDPRVIAIAVAAELLTVVEDSQAT